MKRNTLVLGVTLLLLAAFAWAGWTNWEYRKQAAEKRLAVAARAELVFDTSGSNAPIYVSPLLNKPAPDFTLQDLSGKKTSLSAYKGKALLINFWATWCGPCKIETPWIVELRNQYASQGFEVLGIDSEDDNLDPGDTAGLAKQKTAVADFVKQEHMPYPVLLNGDSLTHTFGDFDAMPTSFFVGRDGKVVAVQLGLTSKDDIESNIRKALGAGK